MTLWRGKVTSVPGSPSDSVQVARSGAAWATQVLPLELTPTRKARPGNSLQWEPGTFPFNWVQNGEDQIQCALRTLKIGNLIAQGRLTMCFEKRGEERCSFPESSHPLLSKHHKSTVGDRLPPLRLPPATILASSFNSLNMNNIVFQHRSD